MLSAMAAMQEAHNRQIHADWRGRGYQYYRAVWVECAELLDHLGWKWWKRQETDLAQVKLELVDIWHFGLSDLLRRGALSPSLADVLDVRPAPSTGGEALRQAVEALAAESLTKRAFPVRRFAQAMACLPLPFAELYGLYVGKNVLNRFRQDHGYQAGAYRKLWDGREDNQHLVELLENSESREIDQDHLYAQLEARYQGG